MLRVVKKINNNYALAYDQNGRLVVVNGLGVGFGALPREVEETDLDKVYRDIDEVYIEHLGKISEDIMKVAEDTVKFAKKVMPKQKFSSKFMFTLADHIDFSIQRYKSGMVYDFAKYYDFESLYEKEKRSSSRYAQRKKCRAYF